MPTPRILTPCILSALVFTACTDNDNGNTPAPVDTGTRIAVANRAAGTVTLIDTDNLAVETITLEPGSEPMYAQNPLDSGEIWIGDRGFDRVLVYDAETLERTAEISAGAGVFHMWNHFQLRQMWVVCDTADTMTVISLDTKEVLATVPVPADLTADFKPHDMSATATTAIVSLLSETGGPQGWLIRYSGETFEEVDRLEVPGDPHLMYWGFEDSALYVASQRGQTVLRLNPHTFEQTGELSIPGAHGIWANETETHLYVSNIESTTGENALYTIDIDSFTLVEGSPVDSVAPAPHNLMASVANDKLFVTHSSAGSTATSVYTVGADGLPRDGQIVETGDIPFGIMLIH